MHAESTDCQLPWYDIRGSVADISTSDEPKGAVGDGTTEVAVPDGTPVAVGRAVVGAGGGGAAGAVVVAGGGGGGGGGGACVAGVVVGGGASVVRVVVGGGGVVAVRCTICQKFVYTSNHAYWLW